MTKVNHANLEAKDRSLLANLSTWLRKLAVSTADDFDFDDPPEEQLRVISEIVRELSDNLTSAAAIPAVICLPYQPIESVGQ